MNTKIKTWHKNTMVNVDELKKEMAAFKEDFQTIISGQLTENEIEDYVIQLLEIAVEFEHLPEHYFWALDNPKKMPSDARIDFVYLPTYLATGIIAYAYLNYEEIQALGIEDCLQYALSACIQRSYHGYGLKGQDGFLQAMEIAANAQIMQFVQNFPEINPEFSSQFELAVKRLTEITNQGDQIFAQKATTILNKIHHTHPKTKVFVYGTLKQEERAHEFLSDATFLGKGILFDYAIYDLGSYPGIIPQKGELVAGEVYEISSKCLFDLDRYEGEGSLYIRKQAEVVMSDKTVQSNIYVYSKPLCGKKIDTLWSSSLGGIF